MALSTPPAQVPNDAMERIFEETKTPFKYGIVIHSPSDGLVDCPSIFRRNGRWYMLYVSAMNKIGYETFLAESDNLLDWKPLGKVLSFRNDGWDHWQADGGLALIDHVWGGSNELKTFDNQYWLSYIGGALQGYETDPLAIGIASTPDPTQPVEWTRAATNPVLGRGMAMSARSRRRHSIKATFSGTRPNPSARRSSCSTTANRKAPAPNGSAWPSPTT